MRARALILLAAALGVSGLAGWHAVLPPGAPASPEVVTIPAGSYTYRMSGSWSREGRRVAPPLRTREAPEPLAIMKYQVDSEYCGARIASGQHRAIVIDFVRDARAGGCGADVPPDHLGIRLVRDP